MRPKLNEVIQFIQTQDVEKIGTVAIIALLHIQAKRFQCKECELWYHEIQYIMEELPIVRMLP